MSVEGNVAKFSVMELHKPYLDPAGTFQFTIPLARTDYLNTLKILPKLHICVILTQIRQIVSFYHFFVQTMPNHSNRLIIK